ncbi:unnamed protein product [Clavelina lepadiformis]|uniref:Uncharacterized protein n=1 Tax=Clavelina lepadiformis TaxID=159417 RepID=A0ABP0EYM2_CLALP
MVELGWEVVRQAGGTDMSTQTIEWVFWGLLLPFAIINGLSITARKDYRETTTTMQAQVDRQTSIVGLGQEKLTIILNSEQSGASTEALKNLEHITSGMSLTSSKRNQINSTTAQSTTKYEVSSGFFSREITKWISIGFSVLICLLCFSLFVTCCRKRIFRQRVKKHRKRNSCKTNADLSTPLICDFTGSDERRDADAMTQVRQLVASNCSAAGSKQSMKLPQTIRRSNSQLKNGTYQPEIFGSHSCRQPGNITNARQSTMSANNHLTELNNRTYEDLITSAAKDVGPSQKSNQDNVYDVTSGANLPSFVEYVNIESNRHRKRRQEHAYETIECEGNEVTILPRNREADTLEGFCRPGIRQQCNQPMTLTIQPEKMSSGFGEIEKQTRQMSVPAAGRKSLLSRQSIDFQVKPVRKSCHRAVSTSNFPDLSSTTAKSRICLLPVESGAAFTANNQPQSNQTRRRREVLPAVCGKVHVRRRSKRKVRNKRRYWDERRSRRLHASYLHSTEEDVFLPKDADGQNRWPLPGVYFNSSSGSSSEVFRFRPAKMRRKKTNLNAPLGEASLLEDIWHHLDEITKNKTKRSDSSQRTSLSITSSTDDVTATRNFSKIKTLASPSLEPHEISPDCTSDRGYFTYRHSEIAKPNSYQVVPHYDRSAALQNCYCRVPTKHSFHTLSDSCTEQCKSSSATLLSDISSCGNESLYYGRYAKKNFSMSYKFSKPDRCENCDVKLVLLKPKLSCLEESIPVVNNDTCEIAKRTITQYPLNQMSNDSYLHVLECYLEAEASTYDKFTNCISIPICHEHTKNQYGRETPLDEKLVRENLPTVEVSKIEREETITAVEALHMQDTTDVNASSQTYLKEQLEIQFNDCETKNNTFDCELKMPEALPFNYQERDYTCTTKMKEYLPRKENDKTYLSSVPSNLRCNLPIRSTTTKKKKNYDVVVPSVLLKHAQATSINKKVKPLSRISKDSSQDTVFYFGQEEIRKDSIIQKDENRFSTSFKVIMQMTM